MAVDRAEVVEIEFLEQGAGHEHALEVFFPAFEEAPQQAVAAQAVLRAFAQRVQAPAGHQARQHLRQRADVFADRHLVVVEDDQHVRIDVAAVVQRLVGHATGQAAVADHSHDLSCVALALRGDGHAERSRNRRRRMTHAETVVLAFIAARKRRQSVLVLDRVDAVAAAGEDLVRIALVADIPDQAVVRRVVQVMQRDGEFDYAQARAEMTAAAGDLLDQERAQFARDRRQFACGELAQVGGRVDLGQQRIVRGIDHLSIFVYATSLGKDCGAGVAARWRFRAWIPACSGAGSCGSSGGCGCGDPRRASLSAVANAR